MENRDDGGLHDVEAKAATLATLLKYYGKRYETDVIEMMLESLEGYRAESLQKAALDMMRECEFFSIKRWVELSDERYPHKTTNYGPILDATDETYRRIVDA